MPCDKISQLDYDELLYQLTSGALDAEQTDCCLKAIARHRDHALCRAKALETALASPCSTTIN